MYNKKGWIIGVVMGFLLVAGINRAEAQELRIKGEFAGTGLTTRIDLNNDGRLAHGGTWVEKSNLGESSAQYVIEDVVVNPPTGACPAGQLETALMAGSTVNTFLKTRDQLFVELTSRIFCVDLVTGAFSGHTIAVITGGAGKFAGATGSLDYRFTGSTLLADFDPASNQVFGPYNGTVEGILILP